MDYEAKVIKGFERTPDFDRKVILGFDQKVNGEFVPNLSDNRVLTDFFNFSNIYTEHMYVSRYFSCENTDDLENVDGWFYNISIEGPSLLNHIEDNGVNTLNLFSKIPNKILDRIRQRKVKILFDASRVMVSFMSTKTLLYFHQCFAELNIPPESFYLIVNDTRLEKAYEYWCIENDVKNPINIKHFEYNMFHPRYVFSDNYRVLSEIEKEGFPQRNKVFLSLNNSWFPHRIALLTDLYTSSLLDNGLVSLPREEKQQRKFSIVHYARSYPGQENNEKGVKYTLDQFRKTLPRTVDIQEGESEFYYPFSIKPYLNTYLSLVSEREFFYEHSHLTPRLVKPMAAWHPFIVQATPEYLKYIRSLGFQTFDGHINEAYDLEENPMRRNTMIKNEIMRLCYLDREDLHKWYMGVLDKVKYNHGHLMNFARIETMTKDLKSWLLNDEFTIDGYEIQENEVKESKEENFSFNF